MTPHTKLKICTSENDIVNSAIKWGSETVKQIPSPREEDFEAVWYSKQELEAIRSSFMKTVELMAKKADIDENDEEHCVRGLECETLRGSASRAANNYDAKSAVFEEQRRQKEMNCYNDEEIARACQSKCSVCAKKAAERGIEDYEAAKRYLLESAATSSSSRAGRFLKMLPPMKAMNVLQRLRSSGSNTGSS